MKRTRNSNAQKRMGNLLIDFKEIIDKHTFVEPVEEDDFDTISLGSDTD
jgi:hypothetical protein